MQMPHGEGIRATDVAVENPRETGLRAGVCSQVVNQRNQAILLSMQVRPRPPLRIRRTDCFQLVLPQTAQLFLVFDLLQLSD
jgi:hypothetical protein